MIMGVTRSCATCRKPLPLREFDLGGGQVSEVCLDCTDERVRTARHLSRAARASKITALETQRRSLIAALVKIDSEIAELQGRPSRPAIAVEDSEELVATTFGEDDDDDDAEFEFDDAPEIAADELS